MAHSTQELMDLRREAAIKKNKDKWTICDPGPNQRNKEYAAYKDPANLSPAERAQIDAVKDRQTYPPEEQDLW